MCFLSKDAQVLIYMQLKRSRLSKKPMTKDEQDFAIKLFYKSPSAYKYLRTKQINLSGITTIKRLISSYKFKPDINADIFKQLKLKVNSMTDKEKYCTLVFDEMKMKFFLEYSKYLDCVEG